VARAGIDLAAFPRHEIELRGRRQVIALRTLTSAQDLPELAATAVAAQ
jgi:hypothetical protein